MIPILYHLTVIPCLKSVLKFSSLSTWLDFSEMPEVYSMPFVKFASSSWPHFVCGSVSYNWSSAWCYVISEGVYDTADHFIASASSYYGFTLFSFKKCIVFYFRIWFFIMNHNQHIHESLVSAMFPCISCPYLSTYSWRGVF